MKKYREQAELINRLLRYNENISKEDDEKNFDKALNLMKRLASAKKTEALCELLDVFNGENEDFGGFCESTKTHIAINYSLDQLLQAFYKKFDSLINNDMDIAVEMSMWFFEDDKFEEFRTMFNFVKSPKSDRFLDEFLRWFPDYQEEVDILRGDMNRW